MGGTRRKCFLGKYNGLSLYFTTSFSSSTSPYTGHQNYLGRCYKVQMPRPIHRDVFCVDWNSSLDNRINFKTDKQQLLTTAKHPGDLKVLLCSFSSLSCKYEYFHWVVCALAFHLRCMIDFEENDLLQWKQEEIGKGTNTGPSSN